MPPVAARKTIAAVTKGSNRLAALIRYSALNQPGQTPVFSQHRRGRSPSECPLLRAATPRCWRPDHRRSHWLDCRSRAVVRLPVRLFRLYMGHVSAVPLVVSLRFETTIDWAATSSQNRTKRSARLISGNIQNPPLQAGRPYFGGCKSPRSQRPRPLDFMGSSCAAKVLST
jgi:hypothetical protein